MDLIQDINCWIYPMDFGDKIRLVLACSLREDGYADQGESYRERESHSPAPDNSSNSKKGTNWAKASTSNLSSNSSRHDNSLVPILEKNNDITSDNLDKNVIKKPKDEEEYILESDLRGIVIEFTF